MSGAFPVHLLLMLVRLGELTTPILTMHSGVARLWPLLRYLHAIADTPGLRLRHRWKDVERHQKAVASDDLGVALGMHVLHQAFDYGNWVDGRLLAKGMLDHGLLANVGGMPPKVGSMKMADYATLDGTGKIHLIECKGTQKGSSVLAGAMALGCSQKRSLVCASAGMERRIIGQRLVTGVSLALENAARNTEVVIIDPPPGPDVSVLRDRVATTEVQEPLLRAQFAGLLASAGAARTSALMIQDPLRWRFPNMRERRRRESESARDADLEVLEHFTEDGEEWIGQTAKVPLWGPLEIDGERYQRARLVRAVSARLMSDAIETDLSSGMFNDRLPFFALGETKEIAVGEGPFAKIVRPGISIASVELN